MNIKQTNLLGNTLTEQVIKYRWEDFGPAITFSSGNKMKFFGNYIKFYVGEKFCIGFSKNNKRFECPEKRPVKTGWHCNECMINDGFFMCVKCSGKTCINPKRRGECKKDKFFIYLAAFGNFLKVGISYEHRLKKRLIEQGADFGAKIGYVEDGFLVRRIEQEIRQHLGIVDRLRGYQKNNHILADPNKEVENIKNAVEKLHNNGFNEYLIKPEIFDLRSYYKIENLHKNPDFIDVSKVIKVEGQVMAVKGNLIVIQNKNLVSFNAHDMIGREINQ
jgi:hypothetical protein